MSDSHEQPKPPPIMAYVNFLENYIEYLEDRIEWLEEEPEESEITRAIEVLPENAE